MLNPVNHASTRAGVHAYKVEPYVVAADIYGEAPQVRRGGWTWYTGAAGWMYRAGTEWFLGIRKQGDTLHSEPCIPRHGSGFEATLRHGGAHYEIRVENPARLNGDVSRIEVDDVPIEGSVVTLVDDGSVHRVNVTLGARH